MLGIDAVTAAILGLSVLLITGVVTWKECLGESVAWDTLTWFAALIAMAGYLNKYGLISWFSQTVVKVSYRLHHQFCGSGKIDSGSGWVVIGQNWSPFFNSIND